VKKLQFLHENTTCLHGKTKNYVIMTSFNDSITQVNQNGNYRVANKNRTFLRYHIFAASTDIIMRFLLKCSEITAENNKRQFFLK